MHGIKRSKVDAATLAAKREKEKAKISNYLELEARILNQKEANDWSTEALQVTEQLLTTNPEHYTVWNYRRDIFVNGIFPQSTPENIHKLLFSDLGFTTSALKRYPKVYWIWNHRQWCLENMPEGPFDGEGTKSDGWKRSAWSQEMFIVEKMLDLDARNFHAWNYRRYILSHCPKSQQRTDADELSYTTRKIESNFSNFSAWHQRSLVYSKLWEEDPSAREKVLDQEFELVRQALYIDPNDQSGWTYHRWLIGSGDDPKVLEREIESITELLELEPGSKWCLNSLVQYKQILLRHRPNERENIIDDCKKMLAKLSSIDSKRRNRYADLGSLL